MQEVFKQVAASLKKGGQFAFVAPLNFTFVSLFCPLPEMISLECQQLMTEKLYIPTSEELHQLASNHGFVTSFTKEGVQIWKYESVSKYVDFLRTHRHQYGIEHYNVEVMKEYYGEEVAIKIPYVTEILKRCIINY